MDDILKHIYFLSKEIGPRASGSIKERKASAYIKNIFDNLRIESKIEEFRTPTSFSITFGLLYFLVVFSTLFFTSYIYIGFIISFLATYIFYQEIHTKGFLSKIFSFGVSQNIIGKIPAKSSSYNKVFLVAHYDSSKAGPMFAPKFVKNFRFLFILNFYSMFIITLILFIGIFFKNLSPVLWLLSLPFTLLLITTIFLMIVREFFFTATPGANDNASGVCVMLNTAEEIVKSPFEHTEIYFLSTGAEEVGMIGMLRFLQRHKDKFKDAYFINLDNLGSGSLKYVIKEGMVKSYFANRELRYIAENVILENNFKIQPFVYRTMSTDAYALLVRGFKAMSVMGFDENGLLPNWHWITDVIENIKIENIRDCQKFVIKMIKEIDRR